MQTTHPGHHHRRWGSASIPADFASPPPAAPMSAPHTSTTSRLGLFAPPPSSILAYSNHHPNRNANKRLRNDIGDDEKEEIRMAFQLFDTRKTGKLSYREVKVAMRALDFDVKKAEVKRLMEDYSKESSTEEVDLDEFMEMLIIKYREKDPDEELAKAFKFFDEEGTGKITLKNLRKVARDLGEHITDDELLAMIDEFDKDGDGESELHPLTVSEAEFYDIMKRDDFDT